VGTFAFEILVNAQTVEAAIAKALTNTLAATGLHSAIKNPVKVATGKNI
jgi:hypothetical protein